jgi:hypothetical protein
MGTLKGGALLAVLVVLLLSHRFGRADPTEDYRPALPPDPLATGCYPLPGDARLDFPYQVRRDGDVTTPDGPRRLLVGQYDEIDETEAVDAIVASFTGVGFRLEGDPGSYDAVLRRPGSDPDQVVRVQVEPLPGIGDDTLVRGTFELDLPVHRLALDAPDVCRDPRSTKRWDREVDA